MSSLRQTTRKIICIGRNYADHISELGNTRPARPFFFLKPTTSLLTPPFAASNPILVPRNCTVHYEIELGIIISKTGKNLHFPVGSDGDKKCLDYIKGYVLAIDLTARNVQEAAKKAGLPWTIAKGFDTFCPVSEVIEKDVIKDPHDVRLWLEVNGVRKQDDNTKLMLTRIPAMLEEISGVMTLEEGDLVLTGTPKGVGRIVKGDMVRAGMSVEGVPVEEAAIELAVEDAEAGGFDFEAKL